MPTPVWLGATTGQQPQATQINQFLGTHAIQYIYVGNTPNSNNNPSGGTVNSNSLWVAQSFVASGTYTTGRITLDAAVTGSPPPITYSIQTNSAGAPSGTSLASVVVPAEWYSGSVTPSSIPLPGASLTNGTTYWVVAKATGDPSNFFTFEKSTAVSGASTSTNGTSWTAQAYGLWYSVADNAITGPMSHTWEDGGARWSTVARSALTVVLTLKEYTVAQGTNAYVQSTRTFSYSGADLTGVS